MILNDRSLNHSRTVHKAGAVSGNNNSRRLATTAETAAVAVIATTAEAAEVAVVAATAD